MTQHGMPAPSSHPFLPFYPSGLGFLAQAGQQLPLPLPAWLGPALTLTIRLYLGLCNGSRKELFWHFPSQESVQF